MLVRGGHTEGGQPLLVDPDKILFQAALNDGKNSRLAMLSRPPLMYNEKQLREAAALEVAKTSGAATSGDNNKLFRKRKNLNPDEKAKQDRDRNREHAKNTRLRKKAYVTKLKELLEIMTNQRDVEENERLLLAESILETNEIRRDMVKLFLSYRAQNQMSKDMWSEILDENILFSLPVTPYRSYLLPEVNNNVRVLKGIDSIINDTASLALMLECMGQSSLKYSDYWANATKRGEGCAINFIVNKDDVIVGGDLVICRFTMRTQGSGVGANLTSFLNGMLQCQFNRANKIISAEMAFDVMGYMQQLQQQGAINPDAIFVPNTIDMAMRQSKEARALLQSSSPYIVNHVNEAWTSLTKTTQSEGQGSTIFNILPVVESQVAQYEATLKSCSGGKACSIILMTSTLMLVHLKLLPLTSDSDKTSHILCTLSLLPITSDEQNALNTLLFDNSEI